MSEIEAHDVGAVRCSMRVSSASNKIFPNDYHSEVALAPPERVGCKNELSSFRLAGRAGLAATALTLVGVLWEAVIFLAKFAFSELPVSQVALYRYAIAALALLPVTVFRRALPLARDLPRFLLTGVLIVPGTCLLQYQGMALTSASSAALIIGALPLLLAFCARWFLGERPGRLCYGNGASHTFQLRAQGSIQILSRS